MGTGRVRSGLGVSLPGISASADRLIRVVGHVGSGMLIAVRTVRLLPGRRPLSQGARAGLGAAFVLLSLICAVELADGSEVRYVGLMATVPFLAAVFAGWREVLIAGGAATAVGMLFAMFGNSSDFSPYVN